MYLSWLGYVYGTAGRRDEAQGVLKQLRVLSKRSYVSPYSKMAVYIGLGKKIKWFERVFAERANNSGALTFKVNPVWDSLRSDPRFADLLRRAGFAS